MTVHWRCLDCDEHGTGDRAAEAHTRNTGHATATSHRRGHPATSSPITLTPEGNGTVATCRACGWLTWTLDRHRSLEAGQAHAKKCKAAQRATD